MSFNLPKFSFLVSKNNFHKGETNVALGTYLLTLLALMYTFKWSRKIRKFKFWITQFTIFPELELDEIIYHKIQIMIKQDIYTNANESGEEAQKETMGLIVIGLPQSKK